MSETKKGGIGAFDFFCIGFGAIVGVGWALRLNNWMAGSGGPIPAASGYIMCLIIMVPVALCYCELVPMMPVAGGGAAFAYKAFGQNISFISGWAAFGGFVWIIPWEAIYVCNIASYIFPALQSGDPLYVIAGEGVYLQQLIVGSICSLLLFYANWRGLKTSATVQRWLCIILIGVGLMAMILALFKFDPANLTPVYEYVGRGSHSSFFGGMMAIMLTAPFFLAGFETIPQGVEDAKGSITSVGKTVVLAVGCACLFYAGVLFCLGGAMPWQDFYAGGQFGTPAAGILLRTVYGGGLGQTLWTILTIGALCGLVTTWNGFMIASPRLLMGMARANLIPKVLAKQHPKTGVPTVALACCFGLSFIGPFLGMGLIDPITEFAGTAYVLSWAITSFCVVKLRKSMPDANRPYKVPGGSATAWFGGIVMSIFFVCFFIPGTPVFLDSLTITLFIGWVILGAVLYLGTAPQRNKIPVEQRAAALFDPKR